MQLRVRQVLDQIGGNGRRGLIKYLPEYELPSDTRGIFPSTLLSSYSNNKYSEVGILTETLVLSPFNIGKLTLLENLTHISENQILKDKIIKSKTTTEYLAKINNTKQKLNEFLSLHGLSLDNAEFDKELLGKYVSGHPDAIIGNKIVIEVKTTSKLELDQHYFIQQLSAYMALNPQFTYGVLVLPLQQSIIIIDSNSWQYKTKYLEVLEQKAEKIVSSMPTLSMDELFNVGQLISFYSIGKHISKSKTLLDTVTNIYPGIPYQIFLGSNMNARLNLKNDDLEAAGNYVKQNNIILYIHSPYVINLAAKVDDDWNIKYMQKTMEYSAKLGAKGVVVHVGKSVGNPLDAAYEQMTYATFSILEHTNPECPLLIETPAGQGTEMLRTKEEFVTFIKQFVPDSPNKPIKIGACVDTCHVFAGGVKPSEYCKYVGDTGLLKLVHYNDSDDMCGSCKDRHAFVGRGHIGLPEMTAVADYCGANFIPMVIE